MGSLWPRSCGVESYSYLSRNRAYPTTAVSSIPAHGKVHSIHLWWWWCMVINPNFNNISLYRGGLFYCWRKPEYLEKTTDLSQVTDRLYHIMLYRVRLAVNRVQTHIFSQNIYEINICYHWFNFQNRFFIAMSHQRQSQICEMQYEIQFWQKYHWNNALWRICQGDVITQRNQRWYVCSTLASF